MTQCRTITIAAAKGGVGKTTLTAALAVQAMLDGRHGSKVALLDWEPQGSLTFWWSRRGKPENPYLIPGAPDPVATAARLATTHDYLFIDTAPSGIDAIDRAIEAATFVVIPTHASFFDLAAIRPVVHLCIDQGKPFAFLMNEVNSSRSKINSSSIQTLEKIGGRVLSATVQERTAYVSAAMHGRAGQEATDKRQREPAAAEIEAVWSEIKGLMR